MPKLEYKFDVNEIGNLEDFITDIRTFVSGRLVPSFLGVTTLVVRVEVEPDGGSGSFRVVVETNKVMNQQSRNCVTDTVRSYISGYVDRGKRNTPQSDTTEGTGFSMENVRQVTNREIANG